MSLRIAAIADIHYAEGPVHLPYARRTAIADILLLRAIHRINRFIQPDLTVILGDLVDDGSRQGLEKLKEHIDKLESPCIVLPGNHDGEEFFSVFPSPEEVVDINGVRLLTFVDEEQPDYNARRSDLDIARMHEARAGYDGQLVSLQHDPLLPPNASESPYGYTNNADIWTAFENNHFTLALSGHWHTGDDLVARKAGRAIVAPALCEHPFTFLEINMDGDDIKTIRHELAMPRELELVDYHVHTPFAYCSQNMEVPITLALADEFGLAQLAFTEHSGQLYFERNTYWKAGFLDDGINSPEGADDRMGGYLELAKANCPPAILGLEIDCDNSGNPVIRRDAWDATEVKLGSIHWLKELKKPDDEIDLQAAADEMLGRLSKFAASGIDVLAHPLRIFRKWPDDELPANLIPGIIDLLKKNGVAAEINFHGQITTPMFMNTCLNAGVKVVFGSDSHHYREIGDFYPHLNLIRDCGLTCSDLPDILADLRNGER